MKQVRAEGKEYYSQKNSELTKNLLSEDYGTIEVSDYAPFASITFSNKSSEEIKDIVNQIAKSKSIIEIGVVNYLEAKPQIADNFERLRFDDYSTYSGYGSYDGTGVTIGILEAKESSNRGGIVIESDSNFDNIDLTIRDKFGYSEKESYHATLVASIIGGNNGIARNASLLSVELYGSPYGEVDWMLDQEVNVVNLSYASFHDGDYNYLYDSYFDYITRTYFVTFVAAAGNYDIDGMSYDHKEIGSPGTAFNVITIGSTSDYNTVSHFSSYKESFDINKPNLVAPGGGPMHAGNMGSTPGGTSFAAPHVTGIIALMMDRRALLKSHPEVVNAIITANAQATDLRTYYQNYEYGGCTNAGCKGYEDRFGAGEVRVDDSIDNIYQCRYFEVDDNSDYHNNIRTISLSLDAGEDITVSLFWLRNVESDPIAGRILEDILDLDLRFYDPNSNWIYGSYSRDNNNELFTYHITQTGTYQIVVYQYGEFDEGGLLDPGDMEVYGSVAYKIE